MERNYLKPEIVEETTLERKIVYADSVDERNECTTIVKLIDQDTKLS